MTHFFAGAARKVPTKKIQNEETRKAAQKKKLQNEEKYIIISRLTDIQLSSVIVYS